MLAARGANVALAAKTTEPHPKLPGTIYTAAEECEALGGGGGALPVYLDIRDDESVQASVDATVKEFGGLDILINNASAIGNTGTLETSSKKYDLMHTVNGRGTFVTSRAALPHLLESKAGGRVLNLSPPLNLDPRWLEIGGTAYTMAKYNMSLCALGMSEEFRGKVAFNCLWPRTAIATAAVEMLAGSAGMQASREVGCMSEAAEYILTRDVDVT